MQNKENEVREIAQQANAQSSLVKAQAEAEAKAIVENARSEGLQFLYEELGITTQEQKAAFDYLRTLRAHENIRLTVDYQQLIAGPMNFGDLN